MPAQWQKYPLRTQQEMLAGRNAIIGGRVAQWADEGEIWLREQFFGKGVYFHTSWNTKDREITLGVYRQPGYPVRDGTLLFEVTEKAESFVSHLIVTKILMVM